MYYYVHIIHCFYLYVFLSLSKHICLYFNPCCLSYLVYFFDIFFVDSDKIRAVVNMQGVSRTEINLKLVI